MSIRNICICTKTERKYKPFQGCPAHNAAKEPAPTASDADRAKAAEVAVSAVMEEDRAKADELLRAADPFDLDEWGYCRDAIAAALAAERVAAVADLRVRVEALAEELDEHPTVTFSAWAIAARLRAAVTGTTGDPA